MEWRTVSAPPNLTEASVHVWRGRIDALYDWARERPWLDASECARRDRFRSAEAMRAYVAGRTMMRALTGAYLNLAPQSAPIAYLERGKPCIDAGSGLGPLEFNLSHSGDWAVFAASRSRRVGIDVEDTSRMAALDGLAERYFAPGERAILSALPEAQRRAGFFNAWTRKEAYIKGRAEGLWMALDGFEVSLAPDEPPALLRSDVYPEDPARWTLHAFEPAPGYAGALAVESVDAAPAYFDFTPA